MQRVRFRDPTGRYVSGNGPTRGIFFGGRTYDPESITVLPPCEPTKIVCVGLNCADHAAEEGIEIPNRLMLILKPPNALAGHGNTITLLAGKERIDYEAELGVEIGEQCRNVDENPAKDVIAGYTCINDISNRDDQQREQNWVRGKAFDNAAPIGPLLATPNEVPDDASIELRLNGDVSQQSNRSEFIFSIPELITEITTDLTFEPGDVISTGTTAGVAPLSDGDVVEIEIDGVGVLKHDIAIE